MIYIGIDPGRNTGIAEWNPHEKKFEGFTTTDFWGCIKLLGNYIRGNCEFMVILENPNLNRPVFFPKNIKLNEPQKLKKAQDVGRNKENAYLIQEFCKVKGIKCIEVRPTMKKWTNDTFMNLSKLGLKQSNEHIRDAARLVWGL